ncbi:MAG: Helix-turn-helix domain [Gemmatimonadetes bacterium]|nr:Helix-turn-helix domain [Gemmatimonadota bacterium]
MTQTFNAGEVAGLLGIHRNTVRDWIARGRIKAEKVGRDWQVSADEAERVREELEKELTLANGEIRAAQLFSHFVKGHATAARAEIFRTASELSAAGLDDFTPDHVAAIRQALSHWDAGQSLLSTLRATAGKIADVQEEIDELQEPTGGWLDDPDDDVARATRDAFAADVARRAQ